MSDQHQDAPAKSIRRGQGRGARGVVYRYGRAVERVRSARGRAARGEAGGGLEMITGGAL